MITINGIKNFEYEEKSNNFYSCGFDSDLYDYDGNKKGEIHIDVPNFYLNEKGEMVCCVSKNK